MKFLMGEDECSIHVCVLLAPDVTPKVVAWDNHVCIKQDVDRIVDLAPQAMMYRLLVSK